MTNKVEFVLDAKDTQAVMAWQRMKQNIGAVEDELRKLDPINKKNARSAGEFDKAINWQEMVGGAIQTVGAIGGITGALQIATRYQKELRAAVVETALKMDELNRKHRVQAGLNDLEGEQASAKILDIAERNAVTSTDASAVTRQLVSSGYANPESSGTADAMLKILASSNLEAFRGEDMAKSMGQFLAAFGKEKNAANLLDLGVRTRGLFKSTDVQLSDLSDFAQAAPTFANSGVSLEDTLSTLAILREAEGPAQASTHARNMVGLMSTFAADKNKVKVLKKMNMKPEDVDLVGETIPEALARMKDGLATLKDDAERQIALKTLYGEDTRTGVSIAIKGLDKFKAFGEYQRDEAGFQEGVRINQSGANAQLKRLEVRKERERLKYKERALEGALLREEFNRADEENSLDASAMGTAGFFASFGTGWKGYFREKAFDTGLMSPQDIASEENMANIRRGAESNFKLDEQRQQLNPNAGAIEELNKKGRGVALEQRAAATAGDTEAAARLRSIEEGIYEQIRLMRQQGQPNVSVMMPGQGTPAAPVAASRIGQRPGGN